MQYKTKMSGLSYFAVQIQSWFLKTQFKVQPQSKRFFKCKVQMKSKKCEKCSLYTTKVSRFFSFKLSPNPVLTVKLKEIYSPDPTKFNKIFDSPIPVQSKSSPILISGTKIIGKKETYQARNQLGTPGGAKSFWEGPKFLNYVQEFHTMPNTFFQVGQKIF